ncbi:MAG TPA: hypothetical protein DD658_08595 [Deltaproteobacteria bacterium]|nr:MAG: hypothetical protein A2X88_02385 [Deltaproteobacteria bacterium GWC2_65_14]HBO70167.1 hypothetical protein [Deltaproteobacteria bacterium]
MANPAASFIRRILSPSCPHSESPFFQRAACAFAYSSGVMFFRRASSSLIQGKKSAAVRYPVIPFTAARTAP